MTTPRPRVLTIGFAALGLLTLAGCAVDSAAAGTTGSGAGTAGSTWGTSGSTSGTSGSTSGTAGGTSSGTATGTYADGTYTAQGGYQAPSGTESVSVQLTIVDDTVTAVTVSGDSNDREAREFQSRFASGISAEVVGKDLSSLSVSRVSGSSLTSNGFNAAVEEIRSQAA